MIKLVIFDLDGVLVDAKNIHYEALNEALTPKYAISWNEHLSTYDGLKTTQKLEMLSERKGLPRAMHRLVWETKQKITLTRLLDLTPQPNITTTFEFLVNGGYKIAVCSNSIRKTVLTVLSKLNIIQYCDYILSNEDVKNSKPHPQIYWDAMSVMGVLPTETIIVEDSPVGLLSAARSNAHVLRVSTPSDVTMNNLQQKISEITHGSMKTIPAWTDKNLNVIIPMAGAGSRFEKAGYTFPKPLIDVLGKPMIQIVVENLNVNANYIYVVRSEHRIKYNLDTLLNLLTPGCKIVEIDRLTEGAACTALLAREHINNDHPLFFANSDQYVNWDSNEFFYKMNETNADGGIVTFTSTHPKWSFARVDETGFITEVAEKNPISDKATVGFYYWKKGSDFVKYADQMIAKNLRVNNEFYVCPVYNEAIQNGKRIKNYVADGMMGLGTPEDLNRFLEQYERKSA